MVIARDQVAPCELPQQEVDVQSIGGTVLVRGMDMPQLVRFRSAQRRAAVPLAGETEQDANERAGAEVLPQLLECTVLAADGLPIYTAAQWGVFAAKYLADAVELSSIALKLSGQSGDEPGKS